jgi:hypothetical protein
MSIAVRCNSEKGQLGSIYKFEDVLADWSHLPYLLGVPDVLVICLNHWI